jgi:hypothetical protein
LFFWGENAVPFQRKLSRNKLIKCQKSRIAFFPLSSNKTLALIKIFNRILEMMFRNQRKFKSKIKVKDTQSMLIMFQIIKFKSVYKPKSHLCLILPQGKIFSKQIEIILTA